MISQQCCVTCLFFYFISPDAVFHNNKKTAKVKSNDDSRAKHKAISRRLSDYFGF